MRGKQSGAEELVGEIGITPACAGKTSDDEIKRANTGDHPRVCGENIPVISFFKKRVGSPPRVRGKPSSEMSRAFHVGITPACAGKTAPRGNKLLLSQDHPRVCGENRASLETRVLSMGSPPRVRGKR